MNMKESQKISFQRNNCMPYLLNFLEANQIIQANNKRDFLMPARLVHLSYYPLFPYASISRLENSVEVPMRKGNWWLTNGPLG